MDVLLVVEMGTTNTYTLKDRGTSINEYSLDIETQPPEMEKQIFVDENLVKI